MIKPWIFHKTIFFLNSNPEKVSWHKSKEHISRILVLEICPGVTMVSKDADPKLLCSSEYKDFCIGFQVFLLVMVLVVL